MAHLRSRALKSLSSNEILDRICKIINGYLPVAQVLLFGSRAKGVAQQSSDFDIAIKDSTIIPLEIMAKIREQLDQLSTLKTIDLVDIGRVNAKFREIILTTGARLNDGNKDTN